MDNNENFFITIVSKIKNNKKLFLEEKNKNSYKYSEIQTSSAKYANLLSELGVAKGDRVAIQTEKLVDCIWIYLAILRIGAIYLPLNTAYISDEIEYFLKDAKPKIFISSDVLSNKLQDKLQELNIKNETINSAGTGSLQRKLNDASIKFKDEFIKNDDIACILYTSGTTGKSKGAMITHGNLCSNALTLVKSWRFSEQDILLHALPIYHVHGLFVAINTVILSNASMIFLEKFDVDIVINELHNVTSLMGVPTYYNRLVSHQKLSSEVCKNIRLFVSGSAPLSVDVFERFRKVTGHSILERYGMTETGMITSNPYSKKRKSGTVGFPLENIKVRIADTVTGKKMEKNKIGVIEVKGPNVFKGYWKMPDKTEKEFREDGYFITGDLGFIDDDGYISISGRDKDLIISGGLNVYPAEIENTLDSCEEIIESAVIGLPHKDFGEAVTAIIVSKSNKFDSSKIIADLSESLAKYKIPKNLIEVDELPRNSMGKIQKNNLRLKYKDFYKNV